MQRSFVAVATSAFVLLPAAIPPLAAQQATCCPPLAPPTATCCIGQWEGPWDLGLSCFHEGTCGTLPCTSDEIAHAALIPTGIWPTIAPSESEPPGFVDISGQVLFWTACMTQPGYTTHIWNPAVPDEAPLFHPEILASLNPNGATVDRNGPFCAGHATHSPKLLTVGGVDGAPFESGSPCTTPLVTCGLSKAYWFDPLAVASAVAWSDAPADLGDGRWYPSVTTYLAPSGQFLPLVAGGSWQTENGCGGGAVPFQHTNWWTLSSLGATSWTSHPASGTLQWHSYPRLFQLARPLANGAVLQAGSVLICEQPYVGGTTPYGGRPVRVIDTTGVPQQTVSEPVALDPNPSPTSPTVGGWNYSSGAILHTLSDLTYDEDDPVPHYVLDRVLVSGGSREHLDDQNMGVPPQGFTHELNGGTWVAKSPPITPRIYGNWVILPNRTVLALGGADLSREGVSGVDFFDEVEAFDPGGGPLSPGSWKAMANRPNAPGAAAPVPRGYHHVALLLPDGRVGVLGGKKVPFQPFSDTWVEVYKPPYAFESARPKITSSSIPDITYDEPFCISVENPGRIDYACLIGISSVTHHFDYGQRYVELMTTTDVSGCSGGNLKVLAPPLPAMASEGYYLLFVVELRGSRRVPSKGVFVKLY